MCHMPDQRRLRSVVGLVAVLILALAAVGTMSAQPATAAERALPAWTGGVNLYRADVFTTQKSWLWCTAAGVQIARNIVDRAADHTSSGQSRYFDWMRERNRYDLPLSAGVDAAGWTAGLRHFVDDRYRLVSSRTFDDALRSAVTRLRLTGLPVALTVSHGNHGWILTGFQATADPARTSAFTVTSVRVTGPLYGLQSRNGYDMPPNTKLTTAQLRHYFTPWKYPPVPMVWDGRYVSIQPVPKVAPVKTAAPAPRTTARPTETPRPSAIPSPTPDPTPATAPSGPDASIDSSPSRSPTSNRAHPARTRRRHRSESEDADVGPMAAFLLAAAALAAVVIGASRRRRGRTTPPPA